MQMAYVPPVISSSRGSANVTASCAGLAPRVDGDVRHRAGPEERDERDEVLELRRLHLPQRLAHARGLELEDAGRVATLEHLVRRRVVERDRRDVDVADELHRGVDHVEVAQAEEVDLQEAEGLDVAHRELRDELLVGALLLKRHDVRQRPVGDDDAGCVDRVLAHEPLERLREIDDLAHERIRVVRRPQLLAGLHRLLEVDLRPFRDELRDPVDGAVRHFEHAAGVTNRGARHHRPEGDDLRHAVAPVLLGGVVDDAIAAGDGEVDVDVGHGLPARVQHPLEEQVVLHRVDLGDAQAVGDERAGGRPSARADADAVLAARTR